MDGHPSRRSCRPVLVAVAAVLVALAMAPVAGAHARLITTEPANDAVLDQSPRFVLLRFDEPVETAFGAIRVYDSPAHRVDSGEVERPSEKEARIALDGRLARGTYTATWRAVSADGHPVSGAFVFHVGAPGANPAGVAAQVLEGGTPASVSVLFSIVRALDFLLLLLVGGGTLMLIVGLGQASAQTRLRLSLLLAGAALSACARGAGRNRAPGSGRGRLRSCAMRSIGTSSRPCWRPASAPSGCCRPGRGGVCIAARREHAVAAAEARRACAGGAVAADAVAVRACECLGLDRVRRRRRARHRRGGLGGRPRGARARARLGRAGAVGARGQRSAAVLGARRRRRLRG